MKGQTYSVLIKIILLMTTLNFCFFAVIGKIILS